MAMRVTLVLALLTALSACATGGAGMAGQEASAASETLSGTVAYPERIALPPDARVKVTLSDVGRMDVAATVIAQTEFASEGRQVPLPFSLQYDPARISPNGRYSVSARISNAQGNLMWITDTNNPLPPPGTPMTLRLVRVQR